MSDQMTKGIDEILEAWKERMREKKEQEEKEKAREEVEAESMRKLNEYYLKGHHGEPPPK